MLQTVVSDLRQWGPLLSCGLGSVSTAHSSTGKSWVSRGHLYAGYCEGWQVRRSAVWISYFLLQHSLPCTIYIWTHMGHSSKAPTVWASVISKVVRPARLISAPGVAAPPVTYKAHTTFYCSSFSSKRFILWMWWLYMHVDVHVWKCACMSAYMYVEA